MRAARVLALFRAATRRHWLMPWSEDPDTAIGMARAAWILAMEAGDADAFVSVLTDDVVWEPPRGRVSGRDAMRRWLAGPLATYRFTYTVEDVELAPFGTAVVERGRFRSLLTPRDGGAALPPHVGTYTMVWRHTSAGWRIQRYTDHGA